MLELKVVKSEMNNDLNSWMVLKNNDDHSVILDDSFESDETYHMNTDGLTMESCTDDDVEDFDDKDTEILLDEQITSLQSVIGRCAVVCVVIIIITIIIIIISGFQLSTYWVILDENPIPSNISLSSVVELM